MSSELHSQPTVGSTDVFKEGASTAARFRTTHWTVVLTAFHINGPEGEAAMADLAEVYWYPVYAFLRRRGHNPEEAEDLTQELFLRLVDKSYMRHLKASGGKFRSYLLTVLMHLVADKREYEAALKRIPRQKIISIDAADAEARYLFEPVNDLTPQHLLERRWALAVLDRVKADLRETFVNEGNAKLFDVLLPCLTGAARLLPYAEIGPALGLREGAVKVAVHRLRKRFGDSLRAAISETVSRDEDIEGEIRHFIEVMSW